MGALNRPRKRKGTNRENPRTIPEQIGKIPGKVPKGQKRTKKEGQVQIGKPPRLKPPRLAALDFSSLHILSFVTQSQEYCLGRAPGPGVQVDPPPPDPLLESGGSAFSFSEPIRIAAESHDTMPLSLHGQLIIPSTGVRMVPLRTPTCCRAPKWSDPEFPRKIPKKYPTARNSGLPEFTPRKPQENTPKIPPKYQKCAFLVFLGYFGGIFLGVPEFRPEGYFFRILRGNSGSGHLGAL